MCFSLRYIEPTHILQSRGYIARSKSAQEGELHLGRSSKKNSKGLSKRSVGPNPRQIVHVVGHATCWRTSSHVWSQALSCRDMRPSSPTVGCARRRAGKTFFGRSVLRATNGRGRGGRERGSGAESRAVIWLAMMQREKKEVCALIRGKIVLVKTRGGRPENRRDGTMKNLTLSAVVAPGTPKG